MKGIEMMDNFKLVTDSACELDDDLIKFFDAETVPFSMMLENVNYIDDDHLDVRNFVKAMKQSKHVPKSACPSPEAFAEKFRKAKNVFCTTISSHLSGCYNSAMLAKEMVEQEGGHRVHIFDSWSATAGEIAICIKIKECIEAHMDYDAVVEKVTEFRNGMRTFFILESLDNLIKNGRMNKIVGYVASAMSLRPIMTAPGGEIKLFEKARGSVRAFTRLVELIGECHKDFSDRTLVITHCNNERQASFIKAEAQKLYNFKDICVMPTRGLASMYADNGGVVIAF